MKEINIDKVKYIVLHCTDTICSAEYDVSRVRQWHLNRGFEDIGYHYLIMPDGEIQLGRDLKYEGAHCIGYNNKSIGIAYVGGRDSNYVYADTRTFNQKISMAYIMSYLIKLFPIEHIIGHCDVTVKRCPCFDAKYEFRNFIANIRSNL